jgi:hypothetical protein
MLILLCFSSEQVCSFCITYMGWISHCFSDNHRITSINSFSCASNHHCIIRDFQHYVIHDLRPFKKAVKRPFLIFSDWYWFCCGRVTSRSSRGRVVLVMDECRRTSAISLSLRVVNLEAGLRRRHEGARRSEVERCSHGRR